MRNKSKIIFYKFLFIFIFILVFFIFLTPYIHSANPEISLEVPIFEYSKAQNIAEYILKIYTYSLYVIIPIAIVMIMVSGVKWILAAGNQAKIKEAKKYISGAIIGIIIALLGTFVLNLVGIQEIESQNPTPITGITCCLLNNSFELLTEKECIENNGTIKNITKCIEHGETAEDIDIPFNDSPETGAFPSVGGKCFPVAQGSFNKINWNWGSPREADSKGSGTRCHAGIDIFTKSPGLVVSVEDGEVTEIFNFKFCKSGWGVPGQTSAVMIFHPNLNVTFNYGEIDSSTVKVKKNQKVKAGQILGVATHCGMLHFELYEGKTSSNQNWYPSSPITENNECRKKYLNTLPSKLRDPGPTLQSLQSKMCGET